MKQIPEIHLFDSPGTRSERVRLLLELLEFPYRLTLIDQENGEHKKEQYLKVNPFGKLPGLTMDGKSIVESAAQMMLIADLDPQNRFAPSLGDPTRRAYVQWLIAAPASLEPLVTPVFSRLTIPGAKRNFNQCLAIQTALFEGPYVTGNQLTAADIFLHWGLRLVGRMGLLKDDRIWSDYTQRLEAELPWGRVSA